MQAVAISELQRSPKQAIANTKGLTYVLSNNRKAAGIVDAKFLEFIESEEILELYEDWVLANDPEVLEQSRQVAKMFESGDYSETLTLDQL